MHRLAIILCFISRVIYAAYSVQHHMYSQHASRKSRSDLPTLQSGYFYSPFDNKPRMGTPVGDFTMDPYGVNNPPELKSAEKLRNEIPIYEDVIKPYTTPSISKREVDYALERSAADARYESSRIKSDSIVDKLKSMAHSNPQSEALNEMLARYDSSNEFHMDDDDVRTSSRSLYDNWPYFYYSPYEYEHKKDIFDAQKAKDKRYAADGLKTFIPVHETIENDKPNIYDGTPKYFHDVTDNPIMGDEPFFSFVLNDYYERSKDEDPLIFKGLDWGKDFDHDTFGQVFEDVKRNRRLENSNYYSTLSPPTTNYAVSSKYSQAESVTDKGISQEHEFDKHGIGENERSDWKTEFENKANKFNGFKDFLDNFANKFGSEDHKKKSNYIHQTNQDKGENRNGFRKVYHKDEYQENQEFYDNNNSNTKAAEKGASDVHIGGSEAYLRSQATAAKGENDQTVNNSGNTTGQKDKNSHKGHDSFNTLEKRLNKYIDVAKQAAQSNDADYDQYKL